MAILTEYKSTYVKMLRFIRNYEPKIIAILDMELKEDDDKWGKARDHFIVKIKIVGNDPMCKEDDEIVTCLVSVKKFREYWDEKEAVIFISSNLCANEKV